MLVKPVVFWNDSSHNIPPYPIEWWWIAIKPEVNITNNVRFDVHNKSIQTRSRHNGSIHIAFKVIPNEKVESPQLVNKTSHFNCRSIWTLWTLTASVIEHFADLSAVLKSICPVSVQSPMTNLQVSQNSSGFHTEWRTQMENIGSYYHQHTYIVFHRFSEYQIKKMISNEEGPHLAVHQWVERKNFPKTFTFMRALLFLRRLELEVYFFHANHFRADNR